MSKILIASIFIFIFCAFTFGQSSNCPTISVTGPASVTQPGETVMFTANVSGIDLNKIEYQWSTDKGTIIEGQGTSVITVSTDGLEDSTVTAVVEVKGFPAGCKNSDVETTVPFCRIPPMLIDEFVIQSKPIDAERLNAWIAELQSNPDSTMYFIIYTNEKFSAKEIKKIEDSLKKNFANKQIAANSLVFINEKNSSDGTENRMKIWRVPAGAEPPTP